MIYAVSELKEFLKPPWSGYLLEELASTSDVFCNYDIARDRKYNIQRDKLRDKLRANVKSAILEC